jgi:DnaJ family protein C protein 9
MQDADPISQFFPDVDPSTVDLYTTLGLLSSSLPSADDIKKAYRRAALRHHPDKHATATEDARADASRSFQQVGFAYAVLGDEARRKRYDATGSTAEGLGIECGEDGWDAYFEQMFDKVTKGKLDEMKKAYQGAFSVSCAACPTNHCLGSEEEVEDITAAYESSGGSLDEIMRHIPHSTFDDEPRFIVLVDALIAAGTLAATPAWVKGSKDEKARLVREKAGRKEAREAEQLAKELGVWDEFYGSGKQGPRRGKGKGQAVDEKLPRGNSKAPNKGKQAAATATEDEDEDAEDVSSLQALILKRKGQRKEELGGFFDSLAAKYAEPESSTKKGKRRKRDADDGNDDAGESLKKKVKVAPVAPEISDAEFEALQAKLFGDKAKPNAPAVAKEKRNTKGKKGR